MTTRYQKSQIEDVAETLRVHLQGTSPTMNPITLLEDMIRDFADLFAADNPHGNSCKDCGVKPPFYIPCTDRVTHSVFQQQGFDREKFLSACGLESEE